MFAAVRKAILTRVVTGVLITCVGVHTGVKVRNDLPESCMPQRRKKRGKNTYEGK